MSFSKTAAAVMTMAMAIFLAPAAYTQEANRTDPAGKQTTITGCLTKSSTAGEFTLTDEKTGMKTMVMGPQSLEKHSANHKVELTGAETTHDGKTMFHATKIKHISPTCTAAK